MSRLSRRTFLGASGSVLALAAMGRPAFAQSADIRHFWWGNPERDKRTLAVIDIFNGKNPSIKVSGETLGFADYFTKLTTQIAGGNMPDVIQQGYGVLFEYIANGAVVPLDEFVGKSLDISKIDQSAIDAGTVDGKFYALSIGANSHMAVYNTRLFEEAGIKVGEDFDPYGYTYDQLAEIAAEVKKATGVPGTDDNTADYQNFSDFTVQKGANLYNEDSSYGPTQEIVEEYFATWEKIRNAGGTPAGAESAGLSGVSDLAAQGVVTGKSAMTYLWSNQLVGIQGLMQDALGCAMYPNTAEMRPGSVVQPSQFVCLTRDSKNPEAATAYMSAFVNDLDMTKILGLERGIPSQSDVRAALQPQLSEVEARSVEFFDKIQGKTAALTAPPPSGSGEVEQTFERLAVGVLLGERSISEVASDFVSQAQAILRRA
ncbi:MULTISPECIES: ABC transporter substrate-binding protein [unclassified Devosia]|uniref:ABC transporter substrate-binding protein n=1 Tax=unclassified Devosia TaxID=196773 RepID=UPI00145F37E3|nr:MULTISPECIES: ABC transporter substrate-binding protein [unclassified Devosia]MBJ6986422.1 carbohydrate ABC transporter substrate-binding protein [Devosia sp. MC521]QMW64108.1 carbohydrate ABC transporter substrate-binding protein [Devosia sp. MC521]